MEKDMCGERCGKMRTYNREKYKLKAYGDEEVCKMTVEDDEKHTVNDEYDRMEILYPKAKQLVEEGKHIEIWTLKYEFIQ